MNVDLLLPSLISKEAVFLNRLFSFILGFFTVDLFFHSIEGYAMGLKAVTPVERIGAVVFGVMILLIFLVVLKRFFSNSFYNGFITSTGLFLSFDIVMFHWIFQLHRITNGPEANILEPIFVLVGIYFVWYGLFNERSRNRSNAE